MSPELKEWESFYVIVGSSAAALTGLQFVVMALIADHGRPRSTGAIAAFGSPNIVHFSAALVVSAILSAPWPSLEGASTSLAALGIGGIAYATLVLVRAQRQHDYRPVLEDWIWHITLPYVAYIAVAVAGMRLHGEPLIPSFVIAAATLLLVLIGIHNAWDTVIYISIGDGADVIASAPKAAAPKPQPARRKAKR